MGCRAGLFDAFGRGSGTKKAKDERVEAGARATEGVGHSPEDRAAHGGCRGRARSVEGERQEGPTRARRILTADWRLAWTSENETLFLLEKFPGGVGGGPITQAYQRIDVDAGTLRNEVVFSNGNAFVVDGVIG